MKKIEYKAGIQSYEDVFWKDIDTFYTELIDDFKDKEFIWAYLICVLFVIVSILIEYYIGVIVFGVFLLLPLLLPLIARICWRHVGQIVKDVRDDGDCFRIVRNRVGLYGVYKWSGLIFKSILPIAYNTIVKVSSDLYICAKDCKYGVYCVKRRKNEYSGKQSRLCSY